MEELLPASPASARRARRFVVDALHRLQCDGAADVAELLVSEVVTNAVLHAGTQVRLRVHVDASSVRIEVLDTSPAPVQRRRYGQEATTGRGLALVDALATRWGSEAVDGNGKTVWFELDRAEVA